jgi:transposase
VRTSTLFRRMLGHPDCSFATCFFRIEAWSSTSGLDGSSPAAGDAVAGRPACDRRGSRSWRHLNLGRLRIWLHYAPRRVNCPSCGVVGEQLPLAEHDSMCTKDFEEGWASRGQRSVRSSSVSSSDASPRTDWTN